VNSDILNNQQLTIDEGTINVSSQYSQEYVAKNITSLFVTIFSLGQFVESSPLCQYGVAIGCACAPPGSLQIL
jgi:hypothetical protein